MRISTVVTLPADKQPTIRIIPMPADTNANGTIFGGWVMAQVDLAGSVPAAQRAMGKVATVAVNSFAFKEPVFVGDLVSFYAAVVKSGRTSITIDVEVYAQRIHVSCRRFRKSFTDGRFQPKLPENNRPVGGFTF